MLAPWIKAKSVQFSCSVMSNYLQPYEPQHARPPCPSRTPRVYPNSCPWWRRQWHPTPVLLPGKSHGWSRLVGCSPWEHKELDTTEWFHFHALEKKMAMDSSVLSWRIPGMGEPVGLLLMGSHRVRHDWNDLAATAAYPLSRWCHPNISFSVVPYNPTLNLSQHLGLFKWVSSLIQVAKVLEFQLHHQSFQWTPRTDLL